MTVSTWNAFQWKKKANGKRRRVPRPANEHVVRHYPDLAIVSQELWDRAHATLPAKRKAHGSRTRAAYPLSGLLVCDTCGGSFGAVSRTKDGDKVYRNLGCVTHKARGAAICAEGHTISEKKVQTAQVDYLQKNLSSPKLVEAFVAAFKKRYESQTTEDDERTGKANLVARQEVLVANIGKALIGASDSTFLLGELAREEASLVRFRAELEALQPWKPKVMPHPAAIAAFVRDLQRLLSENPLEAATALKRALQPFRVRRNPDGTWTLNGALGVCDSKSSGGVIRGLDIAGSLEIVVRLAA